MGNRNSTFTEVKLYDAKEKLKLCRNTIRSMETLRDQVKASTERVKKFDASIEYIKRELELIRINYKTFVQHNTELIINLKDVVDKYKDEGFCKYLLQECQEIFNAAWTNVKVGVNAASASLITVAVISTVAGAALYFTPIGPLAICVGLLVSVSSLLVGGAIIGVSSLTVAAVDAYKKQNARQNIRANLKVMENEGDRFIIESRSRDISANDLMEKIERQAQDIESFESIGEFKRLFEDLDQLNVELNNQVSSAIDLNTNHSGNLQAIQPLLQKPTFKK